MFAFSPPKNLRQSGISLPEVLTVMVLLGVLSVYTIPRSIDNNAFFARGFHDETLSLLRYAQKTAVAQRRNVCVMFGAASAQLSIGSLAGVPCDLPLPGPTQNCSQGLPLGTKACIQARTGISYTTTPTELVFDGLGQPRNGAQTIQVAAAGLPIASRILIEDATGFVHD